MWRMGPLYSGWFVGVYPVYPISPPSPPNFGLGVVTSGPASSLRFFFFFFFPGFAAPVDFAAGMSRSADARCRLRRSTATTLHLGAAAA